MSFLHDLIDLDDWNLWMTIVCMALSPTWWFVSARFEYHTRYITKLFGNKYTACYVTGVITLALDCIRDWRYHILMAEQPKWAVLQNDTVEAIGNGLTIFGLVMVLSTWYQMGYTGILYGDYFDILKNERVTGFPYNVFNDPQYLAFNIVTFGTSVSHGSFIGLLLSIYHVFLMKTIAWLEDPFTSMIYEKRAKQESLKSDANGHSNGVGSKSSSVHKSKSKRNAHSNGTNGVSNGAIKNRKG
ncbi:unnamed protein product [Owenia fusiformis]|uniref:Phosphatidylethanolamine N-methyltransferase n=1 Tax=Owenia fusiformis TaxID=6347 RepID=A0A8J1XIE6_OWEFU|nr:unnamed protein product [Owenia fusiformis]